MIKKIIDTNICLDYYIDWSHATIDEIRENLNELEQLGATHIDVEIDDDYGSYSVKITPKQERLETDEEYEKRIAYEKKLADRVRERELEQLAKLKAKYDNHEN